MDNRRPPPSISFMIVGTPRSGTTLVQRLACELPGVVVPAETHFWTLFAPQLSRRDFPLDDESIKEAVERYLRLPQTRDHDLDPGSVASCLNGICRTRYELFAAIVLCLGRDGALIGEKTPGHLRWWRLLAGADPRLRFIAVVRDPRAVVSSAARVPFGMSSHRLAAAAWNFDQQELRRAVSRLSASRLLVLRYEDVVEDLDWSRRRIHQFLRPDENTPVAHAFEEDGLDRLYFAREAAWKQLASGAARPERKDAWQHELTSAQQADVATLTWRTARRFDYDVTPPRARFSRRLALSPRDHLRLITQRGSLHLRARRIRRQASKRAY